jgi:primosomal protein N'
MKMRYSTESKPKKCPHCGSSKICEILWGMPVYSEQLQSDLAEKKIVLGGCCVSDEDPTWQCVACETNIYKIKVQS